MFGNVGDFRCILCDVPCSNIVCFKRSIQETETSILLHRVFQTDTAVEPSYVELSSAWVCSGRVKTLKGRNPSSAVLEISYLDGNIEVHLCSMLASVVLALYCSLLLM